MQRRSDSTGSGIAEEEIETALYTIEPFHGELRRIRQPDHPSQKCVGRVAYIHPCNLTGGRGNHTQLDARIRRPRLRIAFGFSKRSFTREIRLWVDEFARDVELEKGDLFGIWRPP